MYNIPDPITADLVKVSNQWLALTTWAADSTAKAHLIRCEKETEFGKNLPMNDRMTEDVLVILGYKMFCAQDCLDLRLCICKKKLLVFASQTIRQVWNPAIP